MKADIVPRGMQFEVLRSVAVLGTNACGTEIHRYLERTLDRHIPSAQIYVALQRLHDRGLLISEMEPPVGRRGYPRRVYTRTTSGQQAYEAGMRRFDSPTGTGGVEDEARATGEAPRTA